MKRNWMVSLTALTLTLALAGCGAKTAAPAASAAPGAASASASAAESAAPAQSVEPDLPPYQETIRRIPSETKANPALAKLIADTWQIPETDQSSTRYYYNYVDLNGDGAQEIFAVAVGMYTSGSGGDSALIAAQENGGLKLLQTFTVVHEPVIVSDGAAGGWRDLIVPYSGGGSESCYQVLKHGGSGYPNVPDGESVETLEGVSGYATPYNSLAADLTTGLALYFMKT